jgi:Flp pilus assembly protein TadD
MAYRAGNDDEAAAGVRQALEANPSLADARYGLALIDQRHARFDPAVDELRRASRAEPSSSVYLAALGEACIRAGRLPDARAALDDLRRLALTHDVVPAQIRILAGDLQRAERLAAARHDSSSVAQGAPARERAQ